MKILLIIPNIEGRVGSPPFNAAFLSSFINNCTDHQSKISDLTFYKNSWKQYLRNQIENETPDLIGISVMSFDFLQALEISAFIKNNYDIKIIFGGVHAILEPEEVMIHNNVDIVCTGEGEYVLKEILDNNLNCQKINGLWYRDNGKIIKNEKRNVTESLDEFPFPEWHDFELEKYFLVNNSHITLMASRGCPYSCTYCSNHALNQALNGKYVRFRSVDNILDEVGNAIKNYSSRGFKYIYFIDDIFILNKKWVLEFCRKYKERGYDKKIKWTSSVRANLVDKEIIDAMKDAGCYQVGMGVESSDDFIRNKIYKRNMSNSQIMNAVKIIKDAGLQLSTQFIIGAPYETVETMDATLEMAQEIDADTIMFSILMPLPGTDIKKICDNEKLMENNKFKDSQVMYSAPVIKSKYATSKQIKSFYNKARNYQIKKYVWEGIKLKKFVFLWDLLFFFFYLKPKYQLEIQNAFKITVKRYVMEKIT
ncbi:MAG: radical SAM protein [Candidatus Brocadiaceae bacterium]|nr:radical SAM protein [Candidatus Brocadiaceae bacterium]